MHLFHGSSGLRLPLACHFSVAFLKHRVPWRAMAGGCHSRGQVAVLVHSVIGRKLMPSCTFRSSAADTACSTINKGKNVGPGDPGPPFMCEHLTRELRGKGPIFFYVGSYPPWEREDTTLYAICCTVRPASDLRSVRAVS